MYILMVNGTFDLGTRRSLCIHIPDSETFILEICISNGFLKSNVCDLVTKNYSVELGLTKIASCIRCAELSSILFGRQYLDINIAM
jgi:hypothetical protein